MLFNLLHVVPLISLIHEHVSYDILQFSIQFIRYGVFPLADTLEQLVYVRSVKRVITGCEIVPVNCFNSVTRVIMIKIDEYWGIQLIIKTRPKFLKHEMLSFSKCLNFNIQKNVWEFLKLWQPWWPASFLIYLKCQSCIHFLIINM